MRLPDEYEIMIAAQMNDPAAMPPAPPSAASTAERHAQMQAAGSRHEASSREDVAGGQDRPAHRGFGPLALPALVAATRVMRGNPGQRD
jgi:hypothetical protein